MAKSVHIQTMPETQSIENMGLNFRNRAINIIKEKRLKMKSPYNQPSSFRQPPSYYVTYRQSTADHHPFQYNPSHSQQLQYPSNYHQPSLAHRDYHLLYSQPALYERPSVYNHPALYNQPSVYNQPSLYEGRQDEGHSSKALASQGLLNFLTASIVMAGIIGKVAYHRLNSDSHSRRKRELGVDNYLLHEDSRFVYKMISDFDLEKCLTKAVPQHEDTSMNVVSNFRNRINRQKTWKNFSDEKIKKLASIFSRNRNAPQVMEEYIEAFSRCYFKLHSAFQQLCDKVQSCDLLCKYLEHIFGFRDVKMLLKSQKK